MVQGYNFDCCVDTDDENGIFTENEIDKENVNCLEEADNDENEHISEEATDNDYGQSDDTIYIRLYGSIYNESNHIIMITIILFFP